MKYRSKCKVCSACPHGRVRYQCKECGGSQICEHGRLRSICKECGGGAICEHGRERSKCKECGGGSICEHSRQRSNCKECRAVKAKAELLGDVDAAEQGVKRKRASPTKGPCEHGVKYRSQCKVCRKCEHGRNRYECKECIASRRGQRTADVSRGAPSQDTEKHARQDTDVDEPSEASENEEPDDPSEVDAAEAAHATTRLVSIRLTGSGAIPRRGFIHRAPKQTRRDCQTDTRAQTEARRRCRPNSPGGRGRGRTGDGR